MKLLPTLLTCLTLTICAPAFAQQENAAPLTQELPVEVIAAPDVTVTDIRIGSGVQAQDGSRIGVHYTGWLFDPKAIKFHGKKFDSSYDRHRPIFLVLGEHRVIQGWEQGLPGMRVGGKRTLLIPSALAYGATGVKGLIPPDATLIFDVELVAAN